MKNIKTIFYDILDKSEQNGLAERVFDILIISLIILNVLAVMSEPSVKDPGTLSFLRIFEIVSANQLIKVNFHA